MTTVLAVAVVAGLAAGLGRGGRLERLLRARLRWGWLLAAGAIGQALALGGALPVHGSLLTACVLASYACLAGFTIRNLGRRGMGVVLVGVALNVLPIAADGGMPVEPGAIAAARIAHARDVPLLAFGAKRHLAGPTDRLRLLDDRIPDWPSRVVLSIGDLVIAVGTAAVVAGLLSRPRAARSPVGATDRRATD